MAFRIWIWALVLPLAFAPQPARSQCCTTPSGAGGHQGMGGESSNERKARKEIDRLLSSEWSRGLLMEALLQDPDFTEDYIGRIVEQPEWRAVAQKKLAVGRDMRSGDEGRMSAGRLAPRSADERRFRLTVDGGGFHPGSLTIPAGRPITLVVTRTSDNTCAKEVVFPSLNETRRLPLNQPVEIRIPPQEKGTLTFACGMDMYHGRLVVQ